MIYMYIVLITSHVHVHVYLDVTNENGECLLDSKIA